MTCTTTTEDVVISRSCFALLYSLCCCSHGCCCLDGELPSCGAVASSKRAARASGQAGQALIPDLRCNLMSPPPLCQDQGRSSILNNLVPHTQALEALTARFTVRTTTTTAASTTSQRTSPPSHRTRWRYVEADHGAIEQHPSSIHNCFYP